MDYFFYNTDTPPPRFRVLIDRGLTVVGGDRQQYGEQLAQLSTGDILLMYQNAIGIIAIGMVKEIWDGVSHGERVYYLASEMEGNPTKCEYRIATDWFLDLSSSPISLGDMRESLGHTPRGAVRRIVKHRSEVASIIKNLWAARPSLPEELDDVPSYPEGAVRRILVNAYERNTYARRECIEHYDARCWICGFSFGEIYGPATEGFIHVHHLRPLSEIGREYLVNPVEDLRPLCPNCHAVVHLGGRCRTIEEVHQMIQLQRQSKAGVA